MFDKIHPLGSGFNIDSVQKFAKSLHLSSHKSVFEVAISRNHNNLDLIDYLVRQFDMTDQIQQETIRLTDIFQRKYEKGLIENPAKKYRATRTKLLAYAFYCACRLHGKPITPKHLIIVMREAGHQFARKDIVHFSTELPIPNVESVDYIKQYVRILVNNKIVDIAHSVRVMNMAHEISKKFPLSGHSPRTVAACAVYMSCKGFDLNVSQRMIAKVAGLTEYTVRQMFRYTRKVTSSSPIVFDTQVSP